MMYIGFLVLMLYAVMFYVICRDMLCTMPWSLIYYAVKPPMRPKV